MEAKCCDERQLPAARLNVTSVPLPGQWTPGSPAWPAACLEIADISYRKALSLWNEMEINCLNMAQRLSLRYFRASHKMSVLKVKPECFTSIVEVSSLGTFPRPTPQ